MSFSSTKWNLSFANRKCLEATKQTKSGNLCSWNSTLPVLSVILLLDQFLYPDCLRNTTPNIRKEREIVEGRQKENNAPFQWQKRLLYMKIVSDYIHKDHKVLFRITNNWLSTINLRPFFVIYLCSKLFSLNSTFHREKQNWYYSKIAKSLQISEFDIKHYPLLMYI